MERERDRYPRQGLAERLGDVVDELRRHPRVVVAIALAALPLLVLLLLTPSTVTAAGVATGNCIYVRAIPPGAAAPDGPIGGPAAVSDTFLRVGAERARCDASHSHEVGGTVEFEELGDRPMDLDARAEDACRSAAEAYAGRPLDETPLALTIVTPDADRWREGLHRAVCLVHRRDGEFLAGPARDTT